MSRQPDTSRPLDLDALNQPSGPHMYEVSPGNSVLRFLRDVKVAARTAAAVAFLGLTACATTASGKAAAAPAAPPAAPPAAAAPAAPGSPPAAPPAGAPPAAPPPGPGAAPLVPPAASPPAPPPPPPAPPSAPPAGPIVAPPFIPPGAMPGTPGVSLFRPIPDDRKFVEWRGAESTNVIRMEIERPTRRRIFLATTPGAPFTLHGGCPPYWDIEMAGLLAGTSPDDAVLHSTVTGRMPDRGTFDVTGQASTREGQVVTAGFDCVGRDGTGAEVDRERLTATVASIGGVPGGRSGTGAPAAPFPFRGNGPHGGADEESSGGPVFVEAAFAVARPISNGSDNNPALDVDIGVDPVNGSDWHEHAQLGGRFRAARASEKVDTVNDAGRTVATSGEITGNTFCGFVRGAWAPEIARRVRAVFGGGPGLCHAQAMETGPNSDIPSATGVAGEVDAGIQFGGQNFGGKAGWEVTFGGQDAFQAHGPFLGLYGRF